MPRPSARPSVLVRAAVVLLPVALLPVLGMASSADPVPPSATSATLASLLTPLAGLDLAPRDGAGHPAVVRPLSYAAFGLDPARARSVLAAAPVDGALLTIALPDPTGTLVSFGVVEDSVMQPGLAARHPEIATYSGRSIEGPSRSIRLDLGTLGMHASVRSPGGGASWYVDPTYQQSDAKQYLSYYGAAVPASSAAFVERDLADTDAILAQAPTVPSRPAAGAPVTRRTYRMAFVTDPTYAAYFGTANVLSAKVALVNRADQVYNDDLAIRFELIDGTDKLNLDTDAEASLPDGPCGASACWDVDTYRSDGTTTAPTDGSAPVPDAPDGCTGALLTRNEFVLGQLVGADSFDIGHIGLGVNGGGIAGLGVVGGASKADGCTGLPAPTGDFYAIDYFSHEVGHQMGGNHTFNGTQINCSLTNRNGDTSVEPGSGTSVMAYAGICGQDNTQPHSDPYFSQRSIDEIDSTVTAAATSVNEVQTVSLAGFDATGDSFELTYPGKAPVVIDFASTQLLARVAYLNAIQTLTGCLTQVKGYDGATNVGDDGFQVTFSLPSCAGTDLLRLGVGKTVGGVTGFVGVQVDGGSSTNGGTPTATTNHAPTINEVWEIAFGEPLFLREDRHRNWGWLLRPSTTEWINFILLTDQLISDNLSSKALDAAGPWSRRSTGPSRSRRRSP